MVDLEAAASFYVTLIFTLWLGCTLFWIKTKKPRDVQHEIDEIRQLLRED